MVEISPYYYISKWEYYEDRADRLAVIADALAVEVDTWQHDSLLMSDKKRADRAEAKLQELIDELDRIANDYISDNNTMAKLALEEMREAIGAALDEAKGGRRGDGKSIYEICQAYKALW